MQKLQAFDWLKIRAFLHNTQIAWRVSTLSKFFLFWLFVMYFSCTFLTWTTWFPLQFGVISSCKRLVQFYCLWKIYLFLLTPNFTWNHVITYIDSTFKSIDFWWVKLVVQGRILNHSSCGNLSSAKFYNENILFSILDILYNPVTSVNPTLAS